MLSKKNLSKIDKLIQELCPDGVKYVELGEIIDYEQPNKYIVEDSDYNEKFVTPVLTAGQTFILGYTNEEEGIFGASKEKPVIIFDDFTTSFHWVDFNFKVKSSAMKILSPRNNEIDFRYVYFSMLCINFKPQTHARHWISKYSNFRIPLPPLEIQQEIVKILNEFTELEAELEAELESRKKQYEYYKDFLLSVDNLSDIQWKKLSEIVDFENGKGHERSVVSDGRFIIVNSKFVSTNGEVIKYTNQQIAPLFINDITIVMSDLPNGKALGRCFLVDKNGRYTLNQRIGGLRVKDSKEIDVKFLYYFLNRNKQFLKYDNGVDQTNLRKDQILNVKVPIIRIDRQKEIVSILDKFEKLVNDISIGLPAELNARRKQYEYYRNKLLTFKEYGA